MTQTQPAGSVDASAPATRLSALEQERALERIESAEREGPNCVCGAYMVAVARDGTLWLECSSVQHHRGGLTGLLGRFMDILGHSRRRVMELPVSN